MNNRIRLLLMLLVLSFSSIKTVLGQTTEKKKKNKVYKAWVTPLDKSPTIRGYLSEVGDSLIIVSHPSMTKGQNIYLDDVDYIKFSRKGKVLRQTLTGAVIGFALGAGFGLLSGDDEDCFVCFSAEEKALVLGSYLSVPGALIGTLTSFTKVKISIHGNTKNQKERLKKYQLTY